MNAGMVQASQRDKHQPQVHMNFFFKDNHAIIDLKHKFPQTLPIKLDVITLNISKIEEKKYRGNGGKF